jgi:hypothetical protein
MLLQGSCQTPKRSRTRDPKSQDLEVQTTLAPCEVYHRPRYFHAVSQRSTEQRRAPSCLPAGLPDVRPVRPPHPCRVPRRIDISRENRGLPILAAGALVPYGEAELYCAGNDLARALAVLIPVGAVQTTPWRYREAWGEFCSASRSHQYGHDEFLDR